MRKIGVTPKACGSASARIFPALTGGDTPQNCRHSAAAVTWAFWPSEPLASLPLEVAPMNMGLGRGRNSNENQEKQNSDGVRHFHAELISLALVCWDLKTGIVGVQPAFASGFVLEQFDQDTACLCAQGFWNDTSRQKWQETDLVLIEMSGTYPIWFTTPAIIDGPQYETNLLVHAKWEYYSAVVWVMHSAGRLVDVEPALLSAQSTVSFSVFDSGSFFL